MPTTYNLPPGLSRNQKLAIAALYSCSPCCSGSSGSSGSHPTLYGASCCGTTQSYTGFCVTIAGGSAYDGTYSLTYQTNQVITRTQTFPVCADTDTLSNGYFSPWVTDCRNVCGGTRRVIRHRIWLDDAIPASPGTVATCVIRHVSEFGPPSGLCASGQAITNGILFTPGTDLVSTSCHPLVLTYSVAALVSCTCVPSTTGPISAVMTEC